MKKNDRVKDLPEIDDVHRREDQHVVTWRSTPERGPKALEIVECTNFLLRLSMTFQFAHKFVFGVSS